MIFKIGACLKAKYKFKQSKTREEAFHKKNGALTVCWLVACSWSLVVLL